MVQGALCRREGNNQTPSTVPPRRAWYMPLTRTQLLIYGVWRIGWGGERSVEHFEDVFGTVPNMFVQTSYDYVTNHILHGLCTTRCSSNVAQIVRLISRKHTSYNKRLLCIGPTRETGMPLLYSSYLRALYYTPTMRLDLEYCNDQSAEI
ncbi:hypothetical protein QTP88_012345 [Uroleucon formosanum]